MEILDISYKDSLSYYKKRGVLKEIFQVLKMTKLRVAPAIRENAAILAKDDT